MHVKDKTECAHGHSYADPGNVYRNRQGHRVCRACRKFHDSRRKRPFISPSSLGAEIRAWRTARGLTRNDLARRLGVAASTLERLEFGRSKRMAPATERAWLTLRDRETDMERLRAITAKARRDNLPRVKGKRVNRISVSMNVEQARVLGELFALLRRGGDPRVLLASGNAAGLARVVAQAAGRAAAWQEMGEKQKRERVA